MPIILTFVLVLIVYVPLVPGPYGVTTVYTDFPQDYVNSIQLESISYTYGAWGALFDTGVNLYYVGPLPVCHCPENLIQTGPYTCCPHPFAGTLWALVRVLTLSDVFSIFALAMFGIIHYLPVIPASKSSS